MPHRPSGATLYQELAGDLTSLAGAAGLCNSSSSYISDFDVISLSDVADAKYSACIRGIKGAQLTVHGGGLGWLGMGWGVQGQRHDLLVQPHPRGSGTRQVASMR